MDKLYVAEKRNNKIALVRLEEFNLNRAVLHTPTFTLPRLKSSLPRLQSRGTRRSAWTPRTNSAKPSLESDDFHTTSNVLRLSEQHLRWEAEQTKLSTTRRIKRTAQITNHRVEMPYFMNGSNKPLHWRYDDDHPYQTIHSKQTVPSATYIYNSNTNTAPQQTTDTGQTTFMTETPDPESPVKVPNPSSVHSSRPQTVKTDSVGSDDLADQPTVTMMAGDVADGIIQDVYAENKVTQESENQEADETESIDKMATDEHNAVHQTKAHQTTVHQATVDQTAVHQTTDYRPKAEVEVKLPVAHQLETESSVVTDDSSVKQTNKSREQLSRDGNSQSEEKAETDACSTEASEPIVMVEAAHIDKQTIPASPVKSQRRRTVFTISTQTFRGKPSDVFSFNQDNPLLQHTKIEDGMFAGVEPGEVLQEKSHRDSLSEMTEHLRPALTPSYELPMKYEPISEGQRESFTNMFSSFDLDNNGRITLDELSRKMFESSPNEQQLKQFLKVFDLNRDKSIDENEFITILALNDKLQGTTTTADDANIKLDLHKLSYFIQIYREMFTLLDTSGDGRLSMEELMVAVTAGLHPDVGTNEAIMTSLMKAIDTDRSERRTQTRTKEAKDGYVDFVEFLSYIPFFLQLHQAILNEPLAIANLEQARLAVRAARRSK